MKDKKQQNLERLVKKYEHETSPEGIYDQSPVIDNFNFGYGKYIHHKKNRIR